MPFNAHAAVAEIDAVLAEYEEAKKKHTHPVEGRAGKTAVVFPTEMGSHLVNLLRNALRRLSPSPEGEKLAGDLSEKFRDMTGTIKALAGALTALRSDYQAGRIQTFRERVHSDMFSDFLEMAEYLLIDEGLKDPAAVLVGGVLEEHLRKLCGKFGVPVATPDGKPKKLDTMNADLVKEGAFGKNEQKQITAWAAIRNSAAHAEYTKYSKDDVDLMARWVRNFISNYPA